MSWSDAVLTAVGRDLNSKALAGQLRLNFTEIWVGDGTLRNIENATDLAHKRMKADILAIEKDDENGTCKVRFQVSNERLTGSSIVIREIGFYMQNERGQTVLFSAVTNDEPQTLPLMGNNGPTRLKHVMAFGYSNAANITMRPSIMEGQNADQVKAAIDSHNRDASSHKNVFDTFVKSVTGNNDTITVRNGAGQSSNITVNNVNYAKQAGKIKSDYDFYSRLQDINQPSLKNGSISYFCATNAMRNKPGIDAMVLQLGWDANDNHDGQLYVPNHNGSRIMYRTQNGSANWSAATSWKEIPYMDDVNAVRGDLSKYLPLSGGTMTGTLTMNGAGQTIKNGNKSANITVSPSGVLDIGGTSTENLNLHANNRPSWYKQNNGGAKALALLEELTSMDTALKALIGGINLKQLAKSTGVKYDFSNESAWYICLGEAFGGLIIQGGNSYNIPIGSSIVFPIKFKTNTIAVNAIDTNNEDNPLILTVPNIYSDSIKVHGIRLSRDKTHLWVRWLAIGC